MSEVIRRLRANAPRFAPALFLLLLIVLLLTGCQAHTPQNTFDAGGEVARKQRNLFYLAMWPAIAVMILVLGGIIVMCLRFRERDPNSRPPKQIEGNTRLELTWTILPAILLLGLGVPTVGLIYDLGRSPDANAYYINVTAQRYSFSFEYPDVKDNQGNALFVPADPHIPVGKQVAFRLHSIDVIHSFWIPRLGGKLDVVPNENNVLWLVADKPDTFAGECAEFCGLNHATMRMTIHADSQADFDAWVRDQQAQLNATPISTPTPAVSAAASGNPGATAAPTPTPTPVPSVTPVPTGS
ncbi:MAG: cytochrome c oxidase subunit II [Anaerolineaceae bacterium]